MTAVSVDVVALRTGDEGVQVLIHRRAADPHRGRWALPGVLLASGERISAAAVRAAGKAGVPPTGVVAVGQLVVFDEPNRDPRGPTLSVATWAVVDPAFAPPEGARWAGWESPPELAFDHSRILRDARPLLAEKLWSDTRFTRALTGTEFNVRTALAVTRSLTDSDVDRGNLNRTIGRVATRVGEAASGRSGGRPGSLWRWRDVARDAV